MTVRAEEIKAERRRRMGHLAGPPLRLAVDEGLIDRDRFEYRWVNDENGRVERLTEKDAEGADWEVVRDARAATDGLGTAITKHAGKAGAADSLRMVLLRKPRDLADEDEAAKQRLIDDRDAAIRSKADPEHGTTEGMYVPGGKAAPTTITASRR